MGRLTTALLPLLTLAMAATSLTHGKLVSQVVPTVVNPNLLGAVTQTTVALQAPFCSALDAEVAALGSVAANLRLFVVATAQRNVSNEMITSSSIGLDKGYAGSGAGSSGWYVALGGRPLQSCTGSPPSLSMSTSYYRVGADSMCSVEVTCNGPLKAGTYYWFKYLVGTVATNGAIDGAYLESSWSKPIRLNKAGDLNAIGVTPGPRSGGMVVVTVILVVLLSIALIGAGLVLVISRFLEQGASDVEKTPIKIKETPMKNNGGRHADDVDGRRNAGFAAEPGPGLTVREPARPLQVPPPPPNRSSRMEDDDGDGGDWDELEVATPTDSGLDTFSARDSFRMQVLQEEHQVQHEGSRREGPGGVDGDDLYSTAITLPKATA
ncbi:uroplakin-3a-like isoform X1 [Lampetra fluviatilis]